MYYVAVVRTNWKENIIVTLILLFMIRENYFSLINIAVESFNVLINNSPRASQNLCFNKKKVRAT